MEKVIDELSASQVTSDDATGEHHQHDNKAVGAVPPTSPGFKRVIFHIEGDPERRSIMTGRLW